MNSIRIYRVARFLIAGLLGVQTSFSSELKLAALFSDHAVLQSEQPVPIWGWAEPGDLITVSFAGQNASAVADIEGKWNVRLDPLPSSAQAQILKVSSSKSPADLIVEDILVGEVWLGSGQSNMAMQVAGCRNFDQEKKAAQWPQIRMFTNRKGSTPEPQSDASGSWIICSPKTVGSFSGTLYFFGRDLHKELSVPVGLINSSEGGTPIQSWIPIETQKNSNKLNKRYNDLFEDWQNFDVSVAEAEYASALLRWEKDVSAAQAAETAVPRKPYPGELRQHQRQGPPGGLFNGKINPLIPYALRGILWYQGEHNATRELALLYQDQLPLLIQSWREVWESDVPFAWVQLPNVNRGQEWSLVREAMLKTLHLPKTGMAVTIDIGEVHNIHPLNKQDVGKRLALWALGDVYGMDVPATSGPLPSGYEIKGDEIWLSFTHVEGGLQTKDGELKGFKVAAADQQWLPADARIDGNQVIVSHEGVASPQAVRYAFDGNPDCNLFNGAGLPASPFRTDDWPVLP